MTTSTFRKKSVRVMATVVGGLMLLAGAAFLLAVLSDTLPGRKLLTAFSQFFFGWWLFSYGLGWHSPFR